MRVSGYEFCYTFPADRIQCGCAAPWTTWCTIVGIQCSWDRNVRVQTASGAGSNFGRSATADKHCTLEPLTSQPVRHRNLTLSASEEPL